LHQVLEMKWSIRHSENQAIQPLQVQITLYGFTFLIFLDTLFFFILFFTESLTESLGNYMKLTKRQEEFLRFVSEYINDWGHAPSFEEIRRHFGFRSLNSVFTYLRVLEKKGYIKLPKRKNLKRAFEIIKPIEARRFELPLLGRVMAGKPIEAVEERDRVVEVPPSMVRGRECFVLEVGGNSMEEDGILDGDLVVVQKQAVAENGEIVVALIEDEATIKRFYRGKDHIELKPAHRDMEPIVVKDRDIRILGKVIGVIRHYR